MKKKTTAAGCRTSRPRGWAFNASAKIVEELFALGDEPRSPTIRIEFKGGTSGNERGQGGMCQVALVEWMARALERHMPNEEVDRDE
jgi:hypothetical protein